MDFEINKQPSCITMEIKNCPWGPSPKEAIAGIYFPLRKAMLKYNGQAPTLVFAPSSERGTIIANFIGGEGIRDEIIESAVSAMQNTLRKYSESELSLADFIKEEKKQYGVEDVDISVITPSKTWFKKSSRMFRY